MTLSTGILMLVIELAFLIFWVLRTDPHQCSERVQRFDL